MLTAFGFSVGGILVLILIKSRIMSSGYQVNIKKRIKAALLLSTTNAKSPCEEVMLFIMILMEASIQIKYKCRKVGL